MSSKFDSALDEECANLWRALDRAPMDDEIEDLRQRLFQDWLTSKRYDELIEYVHDQYELDGGRGDCGLLSEALKRDGDLGRIEKLFLAIIKSRTDMFWKLWPQAESGHIGAMREMSLYAASSMEAYAGLWHGYWSLENQAGQDRIRQEMMNLQGRVKSPKSPSSPKK